MWLVSHACLRGRSRGRSPARRVGPILRPAMAEKGKAFAAGAAPTWRITGNLLMVALVAGTAGAPIVGALRESVQESYGIPFWAIGAGVAALGALAGVVGLAVTWRLPGVGRMTFIRTGMIVFMSGFLTFYLLPESPGPLALAMLAAGWFVLTFGRCLAAISNAVFTDLWSHRPHTGVILLHAVNSIGKLLAPLAALVLLALRPNALLYSGILAVLVLDALTWPRASVAALNVTARDRPVGEAAGAIIRRPLFWLMCAEFLLIGGSEAGVASILPSFIERHRLPAAGLSPRRWSEVVLVAMHLGIVAGRFGGVLVSRRLGERPIIMACLLCGLAVVPAVASASPAVYLPCFFVLGLAFSATWPAHFALMARRFPHDKTVLSMGAAMGTLAGVNGFVLLSSLIGNDPGRLPWAIVISTAGMGVFAVSFFALPRGKAAHE